MLMGYPNSLMFVELVENVRCFEVSLLGEMMDKGGAEGAESCHLHLHLHLRIVDPPPPLIELLLMF